LGADVAGVGNIEGVESGDDEVRDDEYVGGESGVKSNEHDDGGADDRERSLGSGGEGTGYTEGDSDSGQADDDEGRVATEDREELNGPSQQDVESLVVDVDEEAEKLSAQQSQGIAKRAAIWIDVDDETGQDAEAQKSGFAGESSAKGVLGEGAGRIDPEFSQDSRKSVVKDGDGKIKGSTQGRSTDAGRLEENAGDTGAVEVATEEMETDAQELGDPGGPPVLQSTGAPQVRVQADNEAVETADNAREAVHNDEQESLESGEVLSREEQQAEVYSEMEVDYGMAASGPPLNPSPLRAEAASSPAPYVSSDPESVLRYAQSLLQPPPEGTSDGSNPSPDQAARALMSGLEANADDERLWRAYFRVLVLHLGGAMVEGAVRGMTEKVAIAGAVCTGTDWGEYVRGLEVERGLNWGK